jgi:hypothetical protein
MTAVVGLENIWPASLRQRRFQREITIVSSSERRREFHTFFMLGSDHDYESPRRNILCRAAVNSDSIELYVIDDIG